MTAVSYADVYSLAENHGLFLDARVERRQENGVWGMYALDSIPSGSVVASIPMFSKIPKPAGFEYPQEIEDKLVPVHSAAKVLAEGPSSAYYSHVAMFESLDEFERHSVFFCSPEELSILHQMNPILHRIATQFIGLIRQVVGDVLKLDSELDKAHVLRAALNWQNRCWDVYGFLPVLDMFNHSDAKGAELTELSEDGRVGHKTVVDYAAGEQIFISYAPKDMYRHALCYNYFDPEGVHLIDYALRVVRSLPDPFSQAVAQKIAKTYPCWIFESGGVPKMQVRSPGLFFTETGPTQALFDFFKKTSYQSKQELLSGSCSPRSIAGTMIVTIDSLLSANQVDAIRADQVPERIRRFYDLLIKEKAILKKNRDWVMGKFS